MRSSGSSKALHMSDKRLNTAIKRWHDPQRRSWARRQNKVDELPIEPTAWNPDNEDVRLPVRVGHTVSISLIPRDLEQGGRPMQHPAPESAVDTHGTFRDRLPMMLCAALALASAVTMVLLYLDSPFWTHQGFVTAEEGGSSERVVSAEPSPFAVPYRREIAAMQPIQETTKLATRALLEHDSGDRVPVEEERVTITEPGS
ncbi:hypothetical protein MTO96_022201 [Rhipicephalus appendiculatus]